MAIDTRKIETNVSYTLKDVAELLEISYPTVLKLKKEGKFKYSRVGKRFYVSGEELLKYITSDSD